MRVLSSSGVLPRNHPKMLQRATSPSPTWRHDYCTHTNLYSRYRHDCSLGTSDAHRPVQGFTGWQSAYAGSSCRFRRSHQKQEDDQQSARLRRLRIGQGKDRRKLDWRQNPEQYGQPGRTRRRLPVPVQLSAAVVDIGKRRPGRVDQGADLETPKCRGTESRNPA